MAIDSQNILADGHMGRVVRNEDLNDDTKQKLKFEYPMNNKEFPARIIFAVIPNIDIQGVVSTGVDLVEAALAKGEKILGGEVADKSGPLDTRRGQAKNEKKKSIVTQTKDWLAKQAAFYGNGSRTSSIQW